MKKFIGILSVVFFLCLPAAAQTQQAIRVKCGGPAYTDSQGQVWSADYGFNGGQVSSTHGAVSGTSDPGLYQAGRWGDSNAPALTYTFSVANGAYHVNLYFAELYPQDQHVGARVFNVKLQGTLIFQNLDIFAAAGANAALVKGADISVTNGTVQIEFDNIADHAKVVAIEITGNSPAPQMDLNFVYPDGTPVNGTLNYSMSTALVKLGGSTPLSNGSASYALFAAPQIMGLVGQFQVNLSLADSAGHILWQVAMTMNPSSVNFGSVQSSTLTVVVQKP